MNKIATSPPPFKITFKICTLHTGNTVNSERKSQSPAQLSVDYEEVDVIRDVKTTQDIQLMSNEAYGPVKLTVPTSPNVAYGQLNVTVLQRNRGNN